MDYLIYKNEERSIFIRAALTVYDNVCHYIIYTNDQNIALFEDGVTDPWSHPVGHRLFHLAAKTYDENFMKAMSDYFGLGLNLKPLRYYNTKNIRHDCTNIEFTWAGFYDYDSEIINNLIQYHKDNGKEYTNEDIVKLLVRIDANNNENLTDTEVDELCQKHIETYSNLSDSEEDKEKFFTLQKKFPVFSYYRPYYADLTDMERKVLGRDRYIRTPKKILPYVYKISAALREKVEDKNMLVKDFIPTADDVDLVKPSDLPFDNDQLKDYLDNLTIRELRKVYYKLNRQISIDNNITLAEYVLNDDRDDTTIDYDPEFTKTMMNNGSEVDQTDLNRVLKFFILNNSKKYYTMNKVIYSYIAGLEDFTVDDYNFIKDTFMDHINNGWVKVIDKEGFYSIYGQDWDSQPRKEMWMQDSNVNIINSDTIELLLKHFVKNVGTDETVKMIKKGIEDNGIMTVDQWMDYVESYKTVNA